MGGAQIVIGQTPHRPVRMLGQRREELSGDRYAMLGVGSFDTASFGYSIGFMVITLFIGLLIFSKVEKTFMDTV